MIETGDGRNEGRVVIPGFVFVEHHLGALFEAASKQGDADSSCPIDAHFVTRRAA
jgi:hypothetical protein